MYKVFINDNAITLTDNFDDYQSTYDTLFIHFRSENALEEAINLLTNSEIVKELCVYSDDLDGLWEVFRSKYKMIEAAGGIVKNNGKVLMILKNNHWDLPKGKIDGTESVKDTALREVGEECGLKELSISSVFNISYYLFREKDNMALKKITWFLMSTGTEGPLIGDENEGIVDVRWIDAGEWGDLKQKSYPSVIDLLSSVF